MMMCEFVASVPPTPAEWAAMADNHLRALRLTDRAETPGCR